MEKTTDDRVSKVFKDSGAFWAFSNKQFDEQKTEGVKYVSLGNGLICPRENVEKFDKELTKITNEIKEEEKGKRKARAMDLLAHGNKIQNRKILISEAVSRINNFADDSFIAEHYKMLENSTEKNIIEVIDSLLGAINYRYHDRADYEPEVKEVYDINIAIIKEIKIELCQ